MAWYVHFPINTFSKPCIYYVHIRLCVYRRVRHAHAYVLMFLGFLLHLVDPQLALMTLPPLEMRS